jgi:3-oxoacyl-[acyl-carrier protein] reductase
VLGLNGKAALVTGASRGIGRAIALGLARDGVDVAINFRSDRSAAERVATEARALGVNAATVCGDIAQIDQARQIFGAAEGALGGLDILVNNAGVMALAGFSALDEADFDRMFAITKGVYFLMREAAARLRDNGRIISISTGLTRNWAPGAAAYAGSKASIEQFTRSLSKEVGARGITVNAVLPGVTETEMTAGFPEERKRAAAQQTSMGRLGTPEDIADVVGLLASERARWITGQMIVANGGSTP